LYVLTNIPDTKDERLTTVVKQSLSGEKLLGSFKEFWQVASGAVNDWGKTTRMSVLITVVNLNCAVGHWFPQQWHLH
jgi:hypothetical protein